MSLGANPVFQQYRRGNGAPSSSDEDNAFMDLDAFEDITPQWQVAHSPGFELKENDAAMRRVNPAPALVSSDEEEHGANFSENNSVAAELPADRAPSKEKLPDIRVEDVPQGQNYIKEDKNELQKKYFAESDESASSSHNSLGNAGDGEVVSHDAHPPQKIQRSNDDGITSLPVPIELFETREKITKVDDNSDDDDMLPLGQVFRAPSLTHVDTEDDGGTAPISFWEAFILLREDTSFWKRYAPPVPPSSNKKKGIFDFFSCIKDNSSNSKKYTVSPKKEPRIAEDLSFFSALLHIPFNHDHVVLRRILFTIYHSLAAPDTLEPWWKRKKKRIAAQQPAHFTSNAEGEGPRMSSCRVAWDRVGFQGTDPATDLRSTGLLGLFHVLYLIDQYPFLTALLWQVCRGDHNKDDGAGRVLGEELPFVLVCFNITGFVVDAVLKGILKKEIKGAESGNSASDSAALKEKVPSTPPRGVTESHRVGFCPPTLEEQELASRYPVVSSSSEAFIGCIHGFVRAWLRYAEKKTPQKLTVADFHDIRNILFYKWNRKGKQKDLFILAAQARYLSSDALY